MLSRLPPVLSETQFDEKNGWLPTNFIDQCREIATRYVAEHVKRIFDEEKKKNVMPANEEDEDVFEISDTDSEGESMNILIQV